MKIKYQGKDTETGATNVAAFLEEKGIPANEAVIELDGEIVTVDAAWTLYSRYGTTVSEYMV